MRYIPKLTAVVWVLLMVSTAQAQFWGGCRDALGRSVPDRRNYALNDIANSHLDPGGDPIIEFNPRVVLSVSVPTQRFFYLHECGHHALGQIVSGEYVPMLSEQQADCWAARALLDEGLSSDDLRQIQYDLAQSPGDWSHLPGGRRALNLVACIQDRPISPGHACRVGTEYVTQQVIVPQVVPQQVPCQHCGCVPGLGCECQHQFDIVNVTVQVPQTQQVPVQRTVCGQ
jgi:hypothetical protein